jgi:hypothetical protein
MDSWRKTFLSKEKNPTSLEVGYMSSVRRGQTDAKT